MKDLNHVHILEAAIASISVIKLGEHVCCKHNILFGMLLSDLEEAEDWYTVPSDIHVGQIGGVATDKHGHVIIFHRGYNTWDMDSFDRYDVYKKQAEGELSEELHYFCRRLQQG